MTQAMNNFKIRTVSVSRQRRTQSPGSEALNACMQIWLHLFDYRHIRPTGPRLAPLENSIVSHSTTGNPNFANDKF